MRFEANGHARFMATNLTFKSADHDDYNFKFALGFGTTHSLIINPNIGLINAEPNPDKLPIFVYG